MLQKRAIIVSQLYETFTEGTISNREVRYGVRVIARSFNGQVWIADAKGMVLFSSEIEREGKVIPHTMDTQFAQAMKNLEGFSIGYLNLRAAESKDNFLTYYLSKQIRDQKVVFFFHTPVTDIMDIITAVRLNIWVPLLFSLIAVGLILFILSRKLAGPLQQMNKAALALAEGDFLTRVPIHSSGEMGQLAHSFNFMVEKLKQWEDTRQEFLTNISHELRSPLTTLRGLIIGMNDKVIPTEQIPHYLKICDYEVQRLQRLVNELLDLARIQNSNDVYHLMPIDMIAKSQEVIDIIAPAIHEKGIVLTVWIPDEDLQVPFVLMDPDRYAQILNNLLYNAIQFTPSEGQITIKLFVIEDEFVVEVDDSGIGMNEEETKRIWERFFKADPTRGHPSEGTGLGLTIVRHLVVGMNGHISVQSKVGHGTQFRIGFPLFDDEDH